MTTHGSCIRCGLLPAPGSRYCAACESSRAPLAPAREFPEPDGSALAARQREEAQGVVDGRLARLEDEVATLRQVCAGLSGQVAALTRGKCVHGEPVDECAYCDEGSGRDEEVTR